MLEIQGIRCQVSGVRCYSMINFFSVIPAKAGIHSFRKCGIGPKTDSCFRRNDKLFVRAKSKKFDHRVLRNFHVPDLKLGKKCKLLFQFP
ncbi:Uncharacterized protein dnm_005160 [Desulfonema magnum]|uniref:Uncharacterized protein n=1 Tax=Desulfonema magnum TaxID=45655 RepID=A0A975BG05_9BACT|nr:Uncharacterized protein dnm_005160 [Desulfonema magnum]